MLKVVNTGTCLSSLSVCDMVTIIFFVNYAVHMKGIFLLGGGGSCDECVLCTDSLHCII